MEHIDDLDEYTRRCREALAAEIDAERRSRGVTYEALSAYTGMQIKTLHRYISGERDVSAPRLRAIAEGIGIKLSDLMCRVEERIDQP